MNKLDPSGTVFAEFTALAIKHGAVNLGQGFPTLPVPQFIRKAAVNVLSDTGLMHQYTRSEGHLKLCHVLSTYYEDKLNKRLDPKTEIMTTVGASEGISSFIN